MLSGSGGAGAPLIPLESALAVCEEHNMVAEQVCRAAVSAAEPACVAANSAAECASAAVCSFAPMVSAKSGYAAECDRAAAIPVAEFGKAVLSGDASYQLEVAHDGGRHMIACDGANMGGLWGAAYKCGSAYSAICHVFKHNKASCSIMLQ
eukprot:1157758-Pelagomonas_calceolata.AAC.3